MAMSDPLGDMLTRIRNGQTARARRSSRRPASKMRAQRARGVAARGLYPRLTSATIGGRQVAELKIELKYVDGEPVIREIARVSKPGRRIYSRIADLPRSL